MTENFTFSLATRIEYGVDRAQFVGRDVKAFAGNSSRVVLVTDPGIIAAGLDATVLTALESEGMAVEVFSAVESNPDTASVEAAADLIRGHAPGSIIGLGGGSALDVAKLAAVVAAGRLPAGAYTLAAQTLPPPAASTIMIPTTAGTGAEVTRTAVISDRHGRKLWAWGDALSPDMAILDPRMTVGLPTTLTAATALDALVHAIDACTGTNSHPMAAALGLQAVRLITRSLPTALQRPGDLSNRGHLAMGATLAGMAIDQAGCGLSHAMGHALSTIGGLHHGRAVALVLRAAYRWNAQAAVSRHADIARALGVLARGQGEADLALAGADAYESLMTAGAIKISLADDGIGTADTPRLVEATLSEANQSMCRANCRVPKRHDLERLAHAVLTAGTM